MIGKSVDPLSSLFSYRNSRNILLPEARSTHPSATGSLNTHLHRLVWTAHWYVAIPNVHLGHPSSIFHAHRTVYSSRLASVSTNDRDSAFRIRNKGLFLLGHVDLYHASTDGPFWHLVSSLPSLHLLLSSTIGSWS